MMMMTSTFNTVLETAGMAFTLIGVVVFLSWVVMIAYKVITSCLRRE